jgi:hypothetical protein
MLPHTMQGPKFFRLFILLNVYMRNLVFNKRVQRKLKCRSLINLDVMNVIKRNLEQTALLIKVKTQRGSGKVINGSEINNINITFVQSLRWCYLIWVAPLF